MDQIENERMIEEKSTQDSKSSDVVTVNSEAFSALYEKINDAEPSSSIVTKNRFKWLWLLIPTLLTILILFLNMPSQRVAIGIVGITLTGSSVLWLGPKWQVAHLKNLKPEERFQQENEARKTFAQIIGGIIVIGGLYYTGENIKIAQKSADDTQKAATEGRELTRQGQITERFTKAVEQLGKGDMPNKENNLAIRLGGIYALERIANESKADHWPIIELLTAYVRQNAPRKRQNVPRKLDEKEYVLKLDIQAILTALGRRKVEYETESQRLDLTWTDLRNVRLKDANLNKVRLDGAKLNRASFVNVQMENASLTYTDLTSAAFILVKFEGLTFNPKTYGPRRLLPRRTILTDTDFSDSDMSNVRGLECKDIEGARFNWTTVPTELEKCARGLNR